MSCTHPLFHNLLSRLIEGIIALSDSLNNHWKYWDVFKKFPPILNGNPKPLSNIMETKSPCMIKEILNLSVSTLSVHKNSNKVTKFSLSYSPSWPKTLQNSFISYMYVYYIKMNTCLTYWQSLPSKSFFLCCFYPSSSNMRDILFVLLIHITHYIL